jgi:ketosteroid isomerase-like protein
MKFAMRSVLLLGCLGLAFGCATSGGSAEPPKGVDEKAAIEKTLGEWGAALAAKDVPKILAFYSESFKNDEGMDKNGMKELIDGAIANGYLDGAKVITAGAQITVNGEDAVVAPVTLSGNMGELSLGLSLKKEAGSWRIISSRQA